MRYLHDVYPEATYRRMPYTGRKGLTQSGYGKRLPMDYVVRIGKRLYRMRCICFSNAGTPWVRVRGEQFAFSDCHHTQEV